MKKDDILDEIYILVDEARKALTEGLDKEYVQGLLMAIMLKIERE